MAALSALRSNPAIRTFVAQLKARGTSKVIITAIIRKPIVIMNAVLKEGQASNRTVQQNKERWCSLHRKTTHKF